MFILQSQYNIYAFLHHFHDVLFPVSYDVHNNPLYTLSQVNNTAHYSLPVILFRQLLTNLFI